MHRHLLSPVRTCAASNVLTNSPVAFLPAGAGSSGVMAICIRLASCFANTPPAAATTVSVDSLEVVAKRSKSRPARSAAACAR